MTRYLADSSIWAWGRRGKRSDIQRKLSERFARGAILTCSPVVLEVMHRARVGQDYEAVYHDLFDPLDWLPLTDEVARRGVEIQREMAGGTHGRHLRPAVDFLIAAAAEATADCVLWFFDRDLKVICEHTGQDYEAEESAGPGH